MPFVGLGSLFVEMCSISGKKYQNNNSKKSKESKWSRYVPNAKERTSLCDLRGVEPSGVCVSSGLCVYFKLVCKRVFHLVNL